MIKKFIEENLPKIGKNDDVEKAFSDFWASQRSESLKSIAEAENIPVEKFEQLIGEYLYSQKLPDPQEIVDSLAEPPNFRKRQGIINRIKSAIENIVDKFEW